VILHPNSEAEGEFLAVQALAAMRATLTAEEAGQQNKLEIIDGF